MTRCAAVQLGERGIRVNAISPGPIPTGIFGKGAGLEPAAADRNLDAAHAGISAVLQRWQPLPYVGMTEDIAQAALFLASDASRLINGHNLVVDGGISVGWPAAVVCEDLDAFRSAFRAARAWDVTRLRALYHPRLDPLPFAILCLVQCTTGVAHDQAAANENLKRLIIGLSGHQPKKMFSCHCSDARVEGGAQPCVRRRRGD